LKISFRAGNQSCKTGNKTDHDKILRLCRHRQPQKYIEFYYLCGLFNTKSDEKEEIFNL